jgi:hypothetical protein
LRAAVKYQDDFEDEGSDLNLTSSRGGAGIGIGAGGWQTDSTEQQRVVEALRGRSGGAMLTEL